MGIVENGWEMSYPVWEMARRFSATPPSLAFSLPVPTPTNPQLLQSSLLPADRSGPAPSHRSSVLNHWATVPTNAPFLTQ